MKYAETPVLSLQEFKQVEDKSFPFGIWFEQNNKKIFLPIVDIPSFQKELKQNPINMYFCFINEDKTEQFAVKKEYTIEEMKNFLREYDEKEDKKK